MAESRHVHAQLSHCRGMTREMLTVTARVYRDMIFRLFEHKHMTKLRFDLWFGRNTRFSSEPQVKC